MRDVGDLLAGSIVGFLIGLMSVAVMHNALYLPVRSGFMVHDCRGVLGMGMTDSKGVLTVYTADNPPTPEEVELIEAVPPEFRHLISLPCVEQQNNNGGRRAQEENSPYEKSGRYDGQGAARDSRPAAR